jgi:hypothetical protein
LGDCGAFQVLSLGSIPLFYILTSMGIVSLPYTRNFIALRVPLLLVYFSLFKRSSAYQFYRRSPLLWLSEESSGILSALASRSVQATVIVAGFLVRVSPSLSARFVASMLLAEYFGFEPRFKNLSFTNKSLAVSVSSKRAQCRVSTVPLNCHKQVEPNR